MKLCLKFPDDFLTGHLKATGVLGFNGAGKSILLPIIPGVNTKSVEYT
jgi:ABC-type polysaccharide/polyol phosphate transport system ATPase subunit